MNLTPREQAEVEAAIGLAVEPVRPSAELKENIMAKIAVTPQLPALSDDDASADATARLASEPHQAPTTPAPDAPTSGAQAGPAEQRARARWFTRPAGMLVAAAAAVLLFMGGTVVGGQFTNSPSVDVEAQSLAVLTAADDLERASAPVEGGGEATLIWSLEQRKSAILVNDLPPLSAGKTYQLWYIGVDGPIPAGTFDSNTSATSWRVLDGAMSAGDTVGVTVEPTGGSDQPTTDPIVKLASA